LHAEEFAPLTVRRFAETERPTNDEILATLDTIEELDENETNDMKPE
jgi:hypothetical protein